MNWTLFTNTLQETDGTRHRLMPPCPEERIEWLEQRWGSLDPTLRSMLLLFNGAELFIDAVPMVTVLGISTEPPQPPLVWPKECCMDYWLDSRPYSGKPGWPIARTNYDSLWIFDGQKVQEWYAEGDGMGQALIFSAWAEQVIEDGKKYLTEE
jgi:hypothetical protein